MEMNKRQLGKDGPMLSEIGLGAWAIGGAWEWGWGPQQDKDSIATIQKALELGINWIDTAPVYGLGHSEKIVSQAIERKRHEVFIATKCGLVWNELGKVRNNNRPDSIPQQAEDSLRRLNTDHIDLYQIHWPDSRTPVDESWEAMVKLKEQGKVRFIGVSNFEVNLLDKCQKIAHVNSLQPPYSLLDRRAEDKLLAWCRKNRVGVVAYSPLQSGLLTGKFDKTRLTSDDWRHKSAEFKEPQLHKNLQFVEKLRPIADKYNKTITQLAIAWVLAHPAMSSAIVGARRPEQVEEIVGGSGWAIEDNDLQLIENFSAEILK
jgi:aryl-alcohol dehydrogenase-like predicted oxidoreductase